MEDINESSSYWNHAASVAKSDRSSNLYSFMQTPRDGKKRTRDDPLYDPTTLYIPETALGNMTPMERQFWKVKQMYYDVVVFFKKGKFYELYDIDAEIGHREFGLRMVSDARGKMKMAGVPEQSIVHWTQMFLRRGYRVGRVEQMTSAAELASSNSDKSIPREMVKVYSEGTLCDVDMITSSDALYVLSISEGNGSSLSGSRCGVEGDIGLLAMDCSRGHALFANLQGQERFHNLATLIRHTAPKEVLLAPQCSSMVQKIVVGNAPDALFVPIPPDGTCFHVDTTLSFLKLHFLHKPMPTSLSELILQPFAVISALGGIVYYMQRLLIFNDVFTAHFEIRAYDMASRTDVISNAQMVLDAATLEHLEVLHNPLDDQEDAGDTRDAVKSNRAFSSNGPSDGPSCLLHQLDHTVTAAGKRRIRHWILEPLRDADAIRQRQRAVKCFLDCSVHSNKEAGQQDAFRSLYTGICDVERCSVRLKNIADEKVVSWVDPAAYGRKVLSRLLSTLEGIQLLSHAVEETFTLLTRSAKQKGEVDSLSSLHSLQKQCPADISERIDTFRSRFLTSKTAETDVSDQDVDDPDQEASTTPRACPVLKGFPIPPRGEFSAYDTVSDSINLLQEKMEQHRQEAIQDFGTREVQFVDMGKDIYLFEVPIAVLNDARSKSSGSKRLHPASTDRYIEISRTARVVRYRTPEMEPLVKRYKEFKDERMHALQTYLKSILTRYANELHLDVIRLVHVSAQLDALYSLAVASSQPGMVQPDIVSFQGDSDENKTFFRAKGLIHPYTRVSGTITNHHMSSLVIPNDVELSTAAGGKMILLTGPNMGGKSTLMRAVAIAAIYAQIGCHVHATHCSLTPVDRIFTRIGARDNLFQQESTFFVELRETSHILEYATSSSLVLMDELGRGTSTFDGYAVAHGTLRYLTEVTHCLGLFSTHYSFLALECLSRGNAHQNALQGVRPMYMSYRVDPSSGDVQFCYQLVPGMCSSSYGLQVAMRAGLPSSVITMSKEQSQRFDSTLDPDNHVSRGLMIAAIRNMFNAPYSPQQESNKKELK